MSFLYVCLFSNGHLKVDPSWPKRRRHDGLQPGAHAMNTLMPAPVAKPDIREQAGAARLRAGPHYSSSRVHACESSRAGLPGSGRAFSDVSTHKAHCTADLPMYMGGVVWAHQKGAGLSAAGARLRARLVELERYERMAA